MKKISFNNEWTVKKSITDLTQQMLGDGVAFTEAIVDLPHDAMVYEKRAANSYGGTAYGFYEGGDYEYTKIFHVDSEDYKKTFVLEFEGIFNRGRVYVNGAFVGSVHYGYTRLKLDITHHLVFGADNTVIVKVTNSDIASSRWYTGSGLYRPVWMHVGGPVRIAVDGLKIQTPDVSEKVSTVATSIAVEYDGKIQKPVVLKTIIKDADNHIVAEEKTKYTLMGDSRPVIRQRIYLKDAKLWSVENPYLYTCKVEVCDGDQILDQTESSFGIRSITINPVEGMKINGKAVLLRGGCVHHDNGPVGAATFNRAEERRVEILKEAGFNAVRIAHNSSSKAMLDACDRLGMLVMEACYDVWTQSKSQYDYALDFADFWERDIEDMVTKDYNHPSVIIYSIGNEIQDLHTPDGAAWNRKLAEKVRELDNTRFVTNGINGLMSVMDNLPMVLVDLGILSMEQLKAMMNPDADAPTGDINDMMTAMLGMMNELATHKDVKEKLAEAYSALDLCGFNYMRGVYDIYKEEFPNMVYFGSETLPPDIDLNWAKVKEIPACIGDFTWTAWDYIGEAGVGIVEYDKPTAFKKAYPAYLAYCGDIDIIGHRRPMSYYREIVFGIRKVPYLAVQLPEHYGQTAACTPWSVAESVSSWTWKGFEGKPCKVEVYSDAEEVELLVNGVSIGRMSAGEKNRFKAIFETVYEPGKIEAVAHYSNGETRNFKLQTAGEEIQLEVNADRTELAAGDISYLTISLVDDKGILNTAVDRKITVSVEGAGILHGLASADPWSEENFFDTERNAFYGKALAVVRAKNEAGVIKVTVTADGCDPAICEICVK